MYTYPVASEMGVYERERDRRYPRYDDDYNLSPRYPGISTASANGGSRAGLSDPRDAKYSSGADATAGAAGNAPLGTGERRYG